MDVITTAMIARTASGPNTNPITNTLVLADCRIIVGVIVIVLIVITTALSKKIKQDMQITTLPDAEVIVSL